MTTAQESIITAFASTQKPSDIRAIAPHSCPECDELARDFLPYTYAAVPRNVIELHYDSLPLFSPQALLHYLPAYLLYSLQNPESRVTEFTMYQLSPSKSDLKESTQFHKERLEVFSMEQRSAICNFLIEASSLEDFNRYEAEILRAKEIWSNQPNPSFKRDA